MAEAKTETKKPGLMTVLRSLGQVKTGYMLLFCFAAGLPYALVLGTLYAWLSDSGEIDLETMGVFSLIGLAYAFKFLWSPALDRVDIPGLRRLGKRKQWIVTAQVVIGAALVSLSFIAPSNETIGIFSLLAGLAAFASATQDVVIDAWRVDVADEIDAMGNVIAARKAVKKASLFGDKPYDKAEARKELERLRTKLPNRTNRWPSCWTRAGRW